MRGLMSKDFFTLKKKYGWTRLLIDIAIMAMLMFVLEDKGALLISFLLIPLEIMSVVITLATCDEQWKWSKYAISLPVSKKQIVGSRYGFATLMASTGLVASLVVNTISYFYFPMYAYGFYIFVSLASFAITMLFVALILPSNYSLGVNAGFVMMLVLLGAVLLLGFWSSKHENAILRFVVDHFELGSGIAALALIMICGLSYALSVSFFKKKHA
ncbi:ABC-2 transporter permease [Paenibacillaceae bacterium WGS1546]|uniref:ABC-2 transporter permease n=1 Tax=Cohnella sp. WGS1546 TaxID=3366810 RepID=UPI00372D07F7